MGVGFGGCEGLFWGVGVQVDLVAVAVLFTISGRNGKTSNAE